MNELERSTVVYKIHDSTIMGQIGPGTSVKNLAGDFDKVIKLYNPAEIHMQVGRDGGLNYGMIPLMPYRETDYVEVYESAIQVRSTPNEQMLDAYKKSILGTRVEVPTKKLLLS